MGTSRVDVPGLRRVLLVDAAGVGALTAAAVAASIRDPRSSDARGLARIAAVGLVGVGLAFVAVRRVGGRGVPPHPDAVVASSARRLISAGLVTNTLGTAFAIGRHRRDSAAAPVAIILLIGGDVLSALYLERLRPSRSWWGSPRPRCVPSARRR
jgi:hypothetical protein